MIKLSGLTKSFNNHVVLNNINLLIQSGEVFGIIGKSGAGKSTLLRCINALERPDSGEVVVDHDHLTHLSPKELRVARHKTAMIFQQFNLLSSRTVYDNIALPMRIQGMEADVIDKKIHELLPLVELSDKRHAYPAQLSGGQKQRVAIARALSCSPKILLCDEATSALDPETTEAILALLKKINGLYGITIVLITHEMDVVKQICHRLAVIEAGQIIEANSLTNILHDKTSVARKMIYGQLTPPLPVYLSHRLSQIPNNKPLLRLLFDGKETTVPFISQTSRELNLDINILLANIDHVESITCGVLVVELLANESLLMSFIKRCEQFNLSVEILGYVANHDA